MRAAVLLLLVFAALALVDAANGARRQHNRKRNLAEVQPTATDEPVATFNADDSDEEEVREQGLIPVLEQPEEEADEDSPKHVGKRGRKMARLQKRMEMWKKIKAKKAMLKAKAKAKAVGKRRGKKGKFHKGKKGGKHNHGKKEGKGKRQKFNRMKNREECESDADCTEGCCMASRGKKFCSRPMKRVENKGCRRSCQCADDLECFALNEAKQRRRGPSAGSCVKQEAVDLTTGYLLPAHNQP